MGSAISIVNRHSDRDLRERMAGLQVLIADRDLGTARLMKQILMGFGLNHITLSTDAEETLTLLRSLPFDILITEWDMYPLDGLSLVREIRAARDDRRIRRDIPIIMLTDRAQPTDIQAARDAGINEFVVKPFSPKAISSRILTLIDKPREFIAAETYAGPCRRRKGGPPPGVDERRSARKGARKSQPEATPGELLLWAREEITQLRQAYAFLQANPARIPAQRGMLESAAAVHAQARLHGYTLGARIAGMLESYARRHMPPGPRHLVVIGKHVEAISVIFSQSVEQYGQGIAQDLIESLSKLVAKLE